MKNFIQYPCIITIILNFLSPVAFAYKYVKTDGRSIITDFDQDGTYTPFLVKGINYAPYEIGEFPTEHGVCKYIGVRKNGEPDWDCERNIYDDPNELDRDFQLIKKMNANTVRTWSETTPELLKKANEYGLMVIAGFWIPHHLDYTLTSVRKELTEEYKTYVQQFKDDPAILLWSLSNENELAFCSGTEYKDKPCDKEKQTKAFYKIIQDMITAAKVIEGNDAHPHMIVHAGLGLIGRKDLGADDASLSEVDVHGINAYIGKNFGTDHSSIFKQYSSRSQKPLVITEFGTDAWYTQDPDNPQAGEERQDLQAEYIAAAWKDILKYDIKNEGPNNGGVVFVYSDIWYLHKGEWSLTSAEQDYGYTVLSDGTAWQAGQPDKYFNEEWTGIMAISKNPANPSAPEKMHPRKAYYTLQQSFK